MSQQENQSILSHSLGNGVAFLDSEGGARSTLLWTLLRGLSTNDPHPDTLPPYGAALAVKIFVRTHSQSLWMGVVSLGKGLLDGAW